MAFDRMRTIARRLRRDDRGNVLMIFGFSIIPLVFATGMGIDYSRAVRLQTKLNAIADAAALAGVTEPMMRQTEAQAKTAALAMFTAQASRLDDVILDPDDVTVTVVQTENAGFDRVVTVSYVAQSKNIFAGVLNMPTLTVRGTSGTNARTAPNIDFYLLLDTSPSMAIAATTAGIAKMVAATPKQGVEGSGSGGCAFACHQTETDKEGLYNPIDPATGKEIDNYKLARNLKVDLRTDMVKKAAKDLMDTAAEASKTNKAQYRASLSTFDYMYRRLQAKTSDLTQVKTAANNAEMLIVYKNSYRKPGEFSHDRDTDLTTAMNGMNNHMDTPGDGSNLPGKKPQGLMFLVTDGVRDEFDLSADEARRIGPMPIGLCNTIKNRGIRIAVVYTTYYPLPTNDFYNRRIASWQPEISVALRNCASPGLFYEVNTDGDISAALKALFLKAVATAHITQ